MAKTYLLDTHVALWIIFGSNRLNIDEFKSRFLGSNSSRLVFHQVSIWEIQIKYELGKLELPKAPKDFLNKAIEESGFQKSCIEDDAIFFHQKLPSIHKDPFDRMLIAHSAINAWPLITADKLMQEYPIRVELIGASSN